MPTNIYLFHGKDNYTASKKLTHWREEFEKKFGDLNIHIFEGGKLTAGEFNEAICTLPFLSDKKLIIIQDFLSEAKEEERKNLTEYLDKVPEHCLVIFIEHKTPDARTSLYKKLCKIGQNIEFKDLEKPELVQWIKKHFSEKSADIKAKTNNLATPNTNSSATPTSQTTNSTTTNPTTTNGTPATLGQKEAELLADTVGPNLWQMDQEVEKLALYGQNKTIDQKAIEDLASPNLSSSIFKLTDYIATKNARMALKTLNTLLHSGEDLFQIFFMIVRQFRILIQTKSCCEKKMDKNQICKKTGISPYFIMNTISQSKNFSFETLEEIYKQLLQIDIDTKSGRIRTTTGDNTEMRLAMERFITSVCL